MQFAAFSFLQQVGTLATIQNISGSVAFNGTTQALAVTSSAAFNFGTADFTIEAWWRPTVVRRSDVLDFYNPLGTGRLLFGASITTGNLEFYIDNTGTPSGAKISGPATSTLLNQWNHVALTRQTGSIKMWCNGVKVGNTYSASVLNFNYDMALSIMRDHGVANANGSGNLSNVRVVPNVVVYTTNFTKPITSFGATQTANTNGNPSAAITGSQTQFLLNTFYGADFLKDNSVNNLTVTNIGAVTSSALNPF